MPVIISPSKNKDKKFTAYIYVDDKKIAKIHFGDSNYEDYTTHKDKNRKRLYLARHKNEDWNNYLKPGFWSRWILWNKKTISESIRDTAQRFNIKIVLVK